MLLCSLMVAVSTSTLAPVEIFVSPNGTPAGPGTLSKPFSSIQSALEAGKTAVDKAAVTIFVRGGTYYLDSPLKIDASHAGRSNHALTIRPYRSEKVVISGGTKLQLQWEAFRDGIYRATLPEGFATDQLFVNGKRRILARYPNYDPSQRILNGFAADAFSPARAARWANPRGGIIHAMQSAEWGDLRYVITGKDTENRVAFEGGWQNNRQMGMHGTQRYVENIFEELDSPDEWFLDRDAHQLYYFPPQDLDLSSATIEAVRLKSLVEIRGETDRPVRNVHLRGLTFRHTSRTFMENREPLLRSDWTIYRGGAIFLTGTEGCSLEDCDIEQVGGNAIFANDYNRKLTIRGCKIEEAGSNGVCFVGDPAAVRNPLFEYGQRQNLTEIDLTPGPRTDNYPADCLVEDCLIFRSGRVEKQTAPIQISMSRRITVRHCSIYDVPRAGINIGDGTWGGHLIEFCDVFDTVKETGDHGSFNSWGRDRYWELENVDLNKYDQWQRWSRLPFLDAVEPVVIQNNRWRCDHGWDIDLDDGSSNFIIRNNLCLNGGIKNREGFGRVVENNVIVGNTFHPHVWYRHSGDIFRRNIVFEDAYRPAIMFTDRPWGAELDFNLVHDATAASPRSATGLRKQSGRDAHSMVGNAQFVDPSRGNYNVKRGSPALALGFRKFPMDRFGVTSPRLKAIARKPALPSFASSGGQSASGPIEDVLGAKVRDISGLSDRSAYGLPGEYGVLFVEVPSGCRAAKVGLKASDVVIEVDGEPARTAAELLKVLSSSGGRERILTVVRKQARITVKVRPDAIRPNFDERYG